MIGGVVFIVVGVLVMAATFLLYTGHVPVILQIWPYLVGAMLIAAGIWELA